MPGSDVVIIGGGIIGLALGRQLAHQGATVTLLERHQPGREASRAGAGMLAPQGELGQGDFLRLCLESNRLYPHFCAEIEAETGMSCGLRHPGSFALALTDDEAADIRRTHESQTEQGLDVDLVPVAELAQLEPQLTREALLALHFPGDGHVENRLLLAALEQSCRRAGVHIICGVEAVRLIIRDGKVAGIQAASGDWHAPTVVNAAGAWAAHLQVPDESLRVPVFPVRGQMLSLEMPRHDFLRHVVRTPRSYLIPCSDGRLMVGATMELAGFDNRNTAGGLTQLLRGAAELLPAVGELPVRELWSGLRPGTPDHHPILGATSLPGYLLAAGLFRNGLLLAPLVAHELSILITKTRTTDLIAPFSLSRFPSLG